eukprot:2127267-Prorocentrum_lima.AAC.1
MASRCDTVAGGAFVGVIFKGALLAGVRVRMRVRRDCCEDCAGGFIWGGGCIVCGNCRLSVAGCALHVEPVPR